MSKFLTAIIFISAVSISTFAQKSVDERDALGIVNKMFSEMANHNPAAIAALFTKESFLTAVVKNKEGKTSIANFTGESFSKNFAEKRGEIKEDMYEPKTLVDGDLAMVWGRYVFFVDGKISHCGLNSFNLVKTVTGWKIANASSSIDPNACTKKEKAIKISNSAKNN